MRSMAALTESLAAQLRRVPSEHTGSHASMRFWLACVFLVGSLAIAIGLAAGIGSVHLGMREIVAIVMNRCELTHISQTWPASDEVIALQIRIPRVLAAALVGAALSVAGTLFQGLLRNPMADPYVIGTSGGAALGATIGIFLSAELSTLFFAAVPVLAFFGALAAMVLVYWLARADGRTPVVTLLLAGFAVSVILGYTVSF